VLQLVAADVLRLPRVASLPRAAKRPVPAGRVLAALRGPGLQQAPPGARALMVPPQDHLAMQVPRPARVQAARLQWKSASASS
jgi:hypothetical protein